MKAEITAPQGFRAAPEGHTVLLFAKGEIVSGSIAEMAVMAGMARKIDEIAESLERKVEDEQPRRRGRPRKVA